MSGTRKVVINTCYGGFGLSDAAYEKMAEWGVPVRKYQQQPRNPETGLYERVEANEGEVIFDRELTVRGEDQSHDRIYHDFKPDGLLGRYWDDFLDRENRDHPLLVRVVEELGAAANGRCADLRIVEIPADAEYTIEEYDGREHIAEAHRTWYAR